ncbi:MAG: FliM/FliN family flagellar motor switch protein, partial [Gemmataceae bacterium]|nr:FliM/FliN family flagellar motor switch protein [Gemmataceae bacterium]
HPAELRPGSVGTVAAGAALRNLPEDALGTLLTTDDPADGSVLLAVRRPVLLALLAGLLGDTPSSLPADRDPTDLEASLVGYALRGLFLDPLERGWPGPEPLVLSSGPLTAPRAAWKGPASDPVLVAALTAAGPWGEHPVHLILTRAGRWDRLARAEMPRPAADRPDADRGPIEALVRDMRVDVSVLLGTAELTMTEVAGLRPGDLLVLRQKVSDPLDALVAGAPKLRVWPGAVGSRAAVQVHAATTD